MPPVFGPGIALADALVVLGRGERDRRLAVDQREQAGFLAVEKFLDHQRPIARRVGSPPPLPRGVIATVTPLPAASPSALITTGRPKRSSAASAVAGAFDPHIIGGGDAVRAAQVLGEALRAFELGGGGIRPEHRDPGRPQARRRRRRRAALPGPIDDQVDGFGAEPAATTALASHGSMPPRIRPSARCRDCPARRSAGRSSAIA